MLFGAHESIAGGVFNAIERGKKATCDTIQMFNKSNNQWRAKKLETAEVDQYLAAIESTGVTVSCSHTSYLINIASPDEALREKSRNSLTEEMQRCNLLKIPNLVLHPGSHVGSGEELGLATIIESINLMFDELGDNNVTLLLEATAGQGSNLGYKFEQLAQIIDGVEDQEHIGVCLDTCHIFAAGYPLSDPKDFKKTIKQFDDIVGLERLQVIHMNDSKREFASRKDRHEHIGKGHIGLEAFRNIVNDRRLKKVPMILETPKGDDLSEDIENLAILRGLVK
ncbi:MAG: deoxyribonuclease IV [candidate division Zixibacteria bacterium]|nr:deoxyribonuclease IV [candidate division Zixibacteria bacterium]MDH3936177.1 deoxyribonuclease IV [candidate division Zixibacteria bacterium]MDH4032979.1 deoxyribonuclease IV [candidate division Zixibacteria bacterium]